MLWGSWIHFWALKRGYDDYSFSPHMQTEAQTVLRLPEQASIQKQEAAGTRATQRPQDPAAGSAESDSSHLQPGPVKALLWQLQVLACARRGKSTRDGIFRDLFPSGIIRTAPFLVKTQNIWLLCSPSGKTNLGCEYGNKHQKGWFKTLYFIYNWKDQSWTMTL